MLKSVLVPVLTIISLLGFIFGAYLPFAKASSYITALTSLQSARSLSEFEADLNQSLQTSSPIGQREVVKFALTNIESIANQKGQDGALVKDLINYIEPYVVHDDYIFPLLSMGDLYFALWSNYSHSDADYAKTLAYFEEAYALGPKLPPVLYSLLQIYGARGDAADALNTASQIHSYWPDDAQVSAFLAQFSTSTASSTK